MNGRLSGAQMEAFVKALSSAYTPNRLKQTLTFRLEKDLDEISTADDKITLVFALIDTSQREGWTFRLLEAARASNPANADLLAVERALGLGTVPAAIQASLEKIVTKQSTFVNVATFDARLGQLQGAVCAFESPTGGGSGFLVASDLALTNYHVIEPLLKNEVSPTSVHCRFDYKAFPDGKRISEGRAIALAGKWNVAVSPYSPFDSDPRAASPTRGELDYALVRLAEPVGEQAVGVKPEPGAAARGWVTLPGTPAEVAKDDPLFVLQHPQDLAQLPAVKLQPMQLAIGVVLGFAGDGMRLRHNTRTLPGSSGSPCLNADLQPVALHHAGEPNNRLDYTGEYNQAIPLGRIVDQLKTTGITDLIDKSPARPEE